MAGQSVQQAETATRGFVDDRRWMLVDETGRFISQRAQPELCRWQASVRDQDLILRHLDNGKTLVVRAAKAETGVLLDVQVWDDSFQAHLVESAVPFVLADTLGFNCRLVYLGADNHRPLDPDYAKEGEEVSFADGFPYLIANTASLADLSEKYGGPLSMDRFRPNIVVKSDQAYAENDWTSLQLVNGGFRLPKPCSRCNMITIDQETIVKDPAVFATLAAYRKEGRKVMFGMNACWEGAGGTLLTVGDSVQV